MRHLDLLLLRTFVAVADHGSMTAAARQLHLTQGAVSQQVRRLEETLDQKLFARAGRGIAPTQAAERLLGKARQLLALHDSIWSDMTGSALQGSVRLGAPYDLVGPALAPVLQAFTQARPQVELSIACASSPELLDQLHSGALDIAVVEQPADAVSGECLRVEPLVWVGARGGGAHLKRPLPVSMVAPSCAFRPAVLQALRGQAIEWRTVFESGSIEATTATVRTGLAITAWLVSTVPADLEILAPAASALPDLPPFAISLQLPPGGGSPAACELAQCLRSAMRNPHGTA
ncbi:MAG: LysR family transcriptional regulator [Pseudomonadota bacterium]